MNNDIGKIGIVILNYNNWKVTEQCIHSFLLNYSTSSQIHITVIDNGSTNKGIDILKKKFSDDNVEFIVLKQNDGFARANNIGVKRYKEIGFKYCLLSNSDVVIPSGCLEKLVEVFEDKQDAVIVGPGVKNGDGVVIQSSQLKQTRMLDTLGLTRLWKQEVVDETKEGIVSQVESVSGCCFMLNVDRFCNIGMFDENTFLYNEENILARRIYSSHYCTYITTGIYVIHNHGASSGRKNNTVYQHMLKSSLYYWLEYRRISFVGIFLLMSFFSIKYILIGVFRPNVSGICIIKNGIQYLFAYRKGLKRTD